MKIERIVVALFVVALLVRVASMYYAYVDYKEGETSVTLGRSSRNFIEAIYQVELSAMKVENASNKFARSNAPYYSRLTLQNETILNNNLQIVLDSVKTKPTELKKTMELEKFIMDMENTIPPGPLSAPADVAANLLLKDTALAEASINGILSKSNEIIQEELQSLAVLRKTSAAHRKKTLYDTYYATSTGILLIIIVLYALNRDILRRKRAEAKIRESEQKLRRMIEEVGDVIYSSDYQGIFTFINARLEPLTGYTSHELIGKSFQSLVHPDWVEKTKEFYYIQFKNRINETRFEFPIVTKQGDTKWVEQNVVLLNEGNRVKGFQCVVRDITRRKEADENIKTALEKEKQINELKSRFVSLASHEFRTPLSTILSSTELIGEYIEHVGQNPAFIKDKEIHHLKRIKAAIHNMVTTLNNFLSLDQLEQGKTITTPVEFDIKKLAEDILDEVHEKLKTNQQITYEHRTTGTTVFMDNSILKNVMINLLTNAIKYSPEGSIIKLTTNANPNGLEFTVEDSGIGIPETEQENLFERFFRAKNTLNIEGTGLGLSIVKKYIDLLKGHISFISRENKGSIFKVFISNAPHPIIDDYKLINQERT